MEKRVRAADGADAGLQTVTQQHEGIAVKELRNGVEVISVVVRIGVFDVNVRAFQFYKKQRNTVDETHDVSAPQVKVSLNPQLFNRQKIVVFGALKIKKQNLFG